MYGLSRQLWSIKRLRTPHAAARPVVGRGGTVQPLAVDALRECAAKLAEPGPYVTVWKTAR